jgi:predicted PurR-regulated permease PerM
MTETTERRSRDEIAEIAIDVALRVGLLFLLAFLCIFVIAPFITILLWGIILAVTLYPVQQWLAARLGGRGGLASTLIVLFGLAIILGPASVLTATLVESVQTLRTGLADGTILIPPPPDSVATWPIIGEELSSIWWLATTNLEAALAQVEPQTEAVTRGLLKASAGVSIAVLQFALSLIIAGLLFGPGQSLAATVQAFTDRILSERGSRIFNLIHATINNVARGVIGVALLQATLAGIGYLVSGYPFGAAITFVVLVLSILSLPATLVVLATVIYAWTFMEVLPALIFSIYMVPVGLLDNFLRPIIVARGLPVPMAVMFAGVIGGALTGGLLGLFVGPVVLAVGYQLFSAWISDEDTALRPPAAQEEGAK